MLAKALGITILVALAGCATTPTALPEAKTLQPPTVETAKMSGGFSPVVQIPVNDSETKYVLGALYEPEGAGPFPAVILLSGCANWDPPSEVALVKRVNADYLPNGIATLVLDSFTPRGVKGVCSDFDEMVRAVQYRVNDVYAAVTWLNSTPKIDSKHIFLQGYSHGGWTGIMAVSPEARAAHKQAIAGLIAMYPACNTANRFSVPAIILIGQEDDWTSADLCNFLDKKNVEVTIYPGVQHGFASPGLDTVFLGHHIAYQEAAANDAQHRALTFIQSLSK